MQALLPISVYLLMISIGMSLKWGEIFRHWRSLDWLTWVRLWLATFIVPAMTALLLARLLRLTLPETGGLFLIGVVPGAPLTIRNAASRGFNMQMAASYQVWGALFTPVTVPFVIYFSAKLYDRDIWIPPRLLLEQIVLKQFVPLLIGMLLVYFVPRFSAKVQPAITVIGNVLLVVVIVAVLWKMRASLAAITPWLVVAAAALAACSMAAIPLLLRKSAEMTKTLALCNSNRHIGLALLLVGRQLHNMKPVPTIACYALVAPVLMVIYARIFRQKHTAAVAV